jgi:hypothetical protein
MFDERGDNEPAKETKMKMFHFCFFERMRYGGRCPCSGETCGSIEAFGDLSPDMAVNLCSFTNDTIR